MKHEICVNQILQSAQDATDYRVLWISPDNAYAWWISLTGKKRIPTKIAMHELERRLASEELMAVSEPDISISQPTETEEERLNEIWDMMKDAVLDEPAIYEKRSRAAHLQRIAQEWGKSPNNLYRFLEKYWKGGKTKDALRPRLHVCGGRGTQKHYGNKNGGRVAKNTGTSGKVLNDQDFRNFERAVRKYYLTKARPTFKSVYDRMLADDYSRPVEMPDGRIQWHILPEEQCPSLRQFQYWYKKRRDVKTETEKRDGTRTFNLSGRAITGRLDHGLMGPGAQYQMDATIGDIYLVSQFNRQDIIGRPAIYFLIDTFSRMVVGMYIGLEGASAWTGAMMALANAVSDKVAFCAEYGVQIQPEEWPCHHAPSVILADRGEMESRAATNLSTMLGIRVENAPPYRGDLKGIIEQLFRRISENALTYLPGRVQKDQGQRGAPDYRKESALNLREFTAAVIWTVLYHNNKHYMTKFEKSARMMADAVPSIPLELWNWGKATMPGSLQLLPVERVKLAVLPRDTGKVTAKGILFRKLYYTSQKMRDELWFEKARQNGSYPCTVSFDPRNMEAVHVWNDDLNGGTWCHLVDHHQKYGHLSMDEVNHEMEKLGQERRSRLHEDQDALSDLQRKLGTLAEEAAAQQKNGQDAQGAKRLANIRDNRRAEKAILEKQNAFVPDADSAPAQAPPSDEESPTLKRIRAKMRQSVQERTKQHDQS